MFELIVGYCLCTTLSILLTHSFYLFVCTIGNRYCLLLFVSVFAERDTPDAKSPITDRSALIMEYCHLVNVSYEHRCSVGQHVTAYYFVPSQASPCAFGPA